MNVNYDDTNNKTVTINGITYESEFYGDPRKEHKSYFFNKFQCLIAYLINNVFAKKSKEFKETFKYIENLNYLESKVPIGFKKFREGAVIPTAKTEKAAGLDVYAWVPNEGEVVIPPFQTRIIKTGLNCAIPDGYEIQVRSRSGLSTKSVFVINAPGTVDCDYSSDKGEEFELGVIMHNASPENEFIVRHGDRIAQFVVCALPSVNQYEYDTLPWDDSGKDRAGGFGHTGTR